MKNKLEFVLGKRELMGLKLKLSKSKISKINNLQKERGAFKEINMYYLLMNLQREVELVTKVSSFESVAEYKGKSLIFLFKIPILLYCFYWVTAMQVDLNQC